MKRVRHGENRKNDSEEPNSKKALEEGRQDQLKKETLQRRQLKTVEEDWIKCSETQWEMLRWVHVGTVEHGSWNKHKKLLVSDKQPFCNKVTAYVKISKHTNLNASIKCWSNVFQMSFKGHVITFVVTFSPDPCVWSFTNCCYLLYCLRVLIIQIVLAVDSILRVDEVFIT